jgi:hypothetical protein
MFKVLGAEQFEDALLVTPMADGTRWKVAQAFHYTNDAGGIIEVPAGFVTDFASVPRFLWPIVPPFGKYTRAATVHDWLYDQHRKGKAHYSKAYADAIFLEALQDCGCSWWTSTVMWLGVRIGGRRAWKGTP